MSSRESTERAFSRPGSGRGSVPRGAKMKAPLKSSCSFHRALLGTGFHSDHAPGRPASVWAGGSCAAREGPAARQLQEPAPVTNGPGAYFIQSVWLLSSGLKSWRGPVAKAATREPGLLQADGEECAMSPSAVGSEERPGEPGRQLFPQISLRLLPALSADQRRVPGDHGAGSERLAGCFPHAGPGRRAVVSAQ